MDRKALISVFERIDDGLDIRQTLCVIGASAVLGYGHPSRQTDDIDVWRPASDINDRQLAKAAKAADVEIDRGGALPDGIYIQLIDPGIVQLPDYENGVWATGERMAVLWNGDKLTIAAPPPSILVAAKLVRADDRDIDDCIYLLRAKDLSQAAVRRAIETLNDPMSRETAIGNLAVLQVVSGRQSKGTSRPVTETSDKDDGGIDP